MNFMSIGLKEALHLTLKSIAPLPAENVSLIDSVDRVAAADLYARVDSPSMDSSRKDGYAVISHEVAEATVENPVRLQVLGFMAAGGENDIQVKPGTTVRVLTGARIPEGADAVVAEEYVKKGNSDVLIEYIAEPKNILKRGSDVARGKCILQTGQQISPVTAGLLAAAGHSRIPVFRNPVVGILGTGDEIVKPGEPLTEGKLYASNIMTLAGWCRRHGMKSRVDIVRDDPVSLFRALTTLADETDAIITSGGAWVGDHDLVAQVLEELGWEKVFHRIRMGPGKAVGFGMLNKKPVFLLAGGPPSNLMGFLQIALPGILALSGHANPGLPRISATLASDITEGDPDWTDFFFGTLECKEGLPSFNPMEKRSRLNSLAEATAVASIPEGQDALPAGSVLPVQLLI
ncbi:molybdopterin molybdotransferase [Syntrophus gentianae]|uniref:Molybdopterin molybdenumtransferase n=1 Tax=Syntrophus gentianae TaxID=43775 RepID=A0A1H8AW59_9BACT|nr:gephyrin-like molybdotransferase Glp [Syntrophus gentianae]SEM74194.1 molybdopterin molybdotransferase [Syntrophus gentianae]